MVQLPSVVREHILKKRNATILQILNKILIFPSFFLPLLAAYQLLCRLEGIIPAMEAAHALAYLEKLCPTLPNGAKVVVNCSGRGDKDAPTFFKHTQQL